MNIDGSAERHKIKKESFSVYSSGGCVSTERDVNDNTHGSGRPTRWKKKNNKRGENVCGSVGWRAENDTRLSKALTLYFESGGLKERAWRPTRCVCVCVSVVFSSKVLHPEKI